MMLGARTAAWAKSGEVPTAKDYVQDGLLGLWDAKENVGFGKHEANTLKWVDLSGNGRDVKFSSHDFYNFDSISLEVSSACTNASSNIVKKPFSASEYTIEVCCEIPMTSRDCAIISVGGNASNWAATMGYTSTSGSRRFSFYTMARGNVNLGGTIEYIGPMSLCMRCSRLTGDCEVFLNGNLLTSGVTTVTANLVILDKFYLANWNGAREGNIYKFFSVRVYDKFITDDELATNYAIDKARFRLP